MSKQYIKILKMALEEQNIRKEREARGLPTCRKFVRFLIKVSYSETPKSSNKALDMESLGYCEKITFPVPPEVDKRIRLLKNRIKFLQKQDKLFKKNLKEELKEIVNEFRFGETESRGLFDAFKSIKKTVSLKRQRKVRFLVSFLKAFDIDSGEPFTELEAEHNDKKVLKSSSLIHSLSF